MLMCATGAPAWACEKADFEAVVADAASALRELNQKNKPSFQARLKDLKGKRGWSHDQFLREAAPLVQDSEITDYDERSAALVEKIESMGAEAANAAELKCAVLGEVKEVMKSLVAVQTDKWTYMFGKLALELGK